MIGTRGSKGVGFIGSVSETGVPVQVPVPPVAPEEFVDDVGAGDAFLGGFVESMWQKLAVLAAATEMSDTSQATSGGKRKMEELPLSSKLTEKDMKDAVFAGIAAAGACIRCSGCQFPK